MNQILTQACKQTKSRSNKHYISVKIKPVL